MTRRTLNRAIANADPQPYNPTVIANDYMYSIPVKNGAKYFDATYPGWARRVSIDLLDMYHITYSILALVHGKSEELTPEHKTWSQASLRAHGLMPHTTNQRDCDSLTLMWFAAICDRRNTVAS